MSVVMYSFGVEPATIETGDAKMIGVALVGLLSPIVTVNGTKAAPPTGADVEKPVGEAGSL